MAIKVKDTQKRSMVTMELIKGDDKMKWVFIENLENVASESFADFKFMGD